MAKKNYSRAGARKALLRCASTFSRCYMDGYVTSKTFIQVKDICEREMKKLK
tara:strand:+ start:1102 stop:1257 length:156 start_codon:yes stop_codon:yes gene_type:complete